MDKEVKAAILVGGKSERIGENKSFLRFGDSRLLDVIVQRILSVFDDAYLITNAAFPCEDLPIPFISDIYAEKGPLGGIFTALSEIDAPSVFITAGDMPFIEPALIHHMLERINHEHDAVVPFHDGHREPLFAVYSKKARETIKNALHEGVLSVHDVLARLSVVGIDEETVKSFGEHAFFNINTREDYQQALRIWNHDKN